MSTTNARAALQRLIDERGEDYAGLSRLLGKNPAYIQQYIKRGTPKRLSPKDVAVLARYFDVPEALLNGHSGDQEDGDRPPELIPIPRFEVTASAGSGALDGTERPIAHLGFDARMLAQICRAKPQDLSIIKVQGDSMFPVLADGDDIMVDRSDGAARLREGIYVLRMDNTLIVKRLSINPITRRVTIASDNPAYPTWADCKLSAIDVIGRVVWAARKIS
jgi:phage repressor protein C with HTH and peptisase S24 domain